MYETGGSRRVILESKCVNTGTEKTLFILEMKKAATKNMKLQQSTAKLQPIKDLHCRVGVA